MADQISTEEAERRRRIIKAAEAILSDTPNIGLWWEVSVVPSDPLQLMLQAAGTAPSRWARVRKAYFAPLQNDDVTTAAGSLKRQYMARQD